MLCVPPDNPAHTFTEGVSSESIPQIRIRVQLTRINKSVFMAGHVNGDDSGKAEVPHKVWVNLGRVLEPMNDGADRNISYKRGHESAGRGIYVDWSVHSTLNQEVIDGLDILILACVSSSKDAADADGVLISRK